MIIKEAERLGDIQEYYFSKKLREVAAMVAAGKPIINLGIGNPDMKPSDATINKLKQSAEQDGNHGYQPYKGIPALGVAIANWYKKTYEVTLDATSEILPLIGSKEGISHVSQAFLNPGDIALVPNPGYPSYSSATRLAGGIPMPYLLDETNHWEPNWSELNESLLNKAKIWWLSYPNMPTGARGHIGIFEKAIEIAKRHQILIVNDNPYSLILNQSPPLSIHQTTGSREVALELNSLSKSHNMAGWRVGFLTGGVDYINSVMKVKSNIDSGMFKPIQEAAIEAMSVGEEWHMERNKVYAQRRKHVFAIMDALNCTYDEQSIGMFVWGKIPDYYTSVEELTEKILHEANVFLTPGFIFGDTGERYIRISLCCKADLIMEAENRIKALMS
jgi:aspartate/methionine/tyrosine aminotransferase